MEAVEVGDPDTFEQGDDKERNAAAEVVVDGEGVVARVVTEHQGHQTEQQADASGLKFFPHCLWKYLEIHCGLNNSLNCSKLRVKPQGEQLQ